MLLSIAPALAFQHYEILCKIATDTTCYQNTPSSFCMWKPSTDGLFLCAPDICEDLNQPYMKWIMYLIQNFIQPWGYALSGILLMKSFYCVVQNNEVTLESLRNEKLQFTWSSVEEDTIRKSCLEIIRHLLEAIGLSNWELVETIEPTGTKSMIDPLNKKMYLHHNEIFSYCKNFGMKKVLNLISGQLRKFDLNTVSPAPTFPDLTLIQSTPHPHPETT